MVRILFLMLMAREPGIVSFTTISDQELVDILKAKGAPALPAGGDQLSNYLRVSINMTSIVVRLASYYDFTSTRLTPRSTPLLTLAPFRLCVIPSLTTSSSTPEMTLYLRSTRP